MTAFVLVGCGGGQERQASSSALSIQTLSDIPVGQGLYDQQVQEMYIAYYGRPADPGGLGYWSNRVAAAGGSLSAIIQEFGNSAEADSLYKSLGTQGAVTALYQQQFRRAPDTVGLSIFGKSPAQPVAHLHIFTRSNVRIILPRPTSECDSLNFPLTSTKELRCFTQ